MVNIFTALLGVVSVCVLAGVATKILFSLAKVWDEEDWIHEDIEECLDYDELRKGNPHIWID